MSVLMSLALPAAMSGQAPEADPADAEPFARGINSIQLLDDGTRLWVMSIFWDSERPGNPIPDRYLRPGGGA